MTRIERHSFSESTNWRGIKIARAATPGDLIHKTSGEADVIDEVYLWVEHTNAGSGGVFTTVTVEFGGVTSPDDLMVRDIPIQKAFQVVKGRPISGANLEIRVFADVSGEITVWGYINRIFLP